MHRPSKPDLLWGAMACMQRSSPAIAERRIPIRKIRSRLSISYSPKNDGGAMTQITKLPVLFQKRYILFWK